MYSGSPLEALFDLTGVHPLWRTLLALALLGLTRILWVVVHRHPARRRFGGAITFLAIAFAGEAVIPWLPARWKLAMTLRAVSLLAFLFGLVRALVITADLAARRRQGDFSSIFRDLATLIVYGVVILVVARFELGVDVTPLLATSALVTAVIGLALQETLGNVFSGLSLQMQKPFQPGDWVRFQTHLGRVQGIGWRSTRLVTRSLELLEVPNAVLAREVLTNYRGSAIGDELFVGTSYDAPPNRVKEIVQRVLHHNPQIAKSPAPQVWVVEYGDFAVKYRIRFWMTDYSRQDDVRDEIMTSLWYALRRNGIEIPYPIRTLRLTRAARASAVLDQRQRILIAALRQVDFLRELGEEELGSLAPNLYEVEYGRGETICREGEAGDTFYVLRRGTVEVLAHGPNAAAAHVADLSAPAFFGEMSLLTGEPRSATVRAKTDVGVAVVEREGFEGLFRARPSIAEAISRVLADRQSELRERRERFAADEGAERSSQRLLAKMRGIFGF
ncbi:MAG: mechanosensitive ion channel [Deltaproteobacteria bacterium]|nr:mechanosensitive ion channel [Deltaproteobacteria bacterium]